MESNKYLDALKKYDTELNDEAVKAEVEKIIAEGFEQNNNNDVLKFSLGCIDLTSLNPTDNEERIRDFVERVNLFEEAYPNYDNVASICVYPNFAETVSTFLDVSEVHTTVVAAGFPSSQTFDEIKVCTSYLVDGQPTDHVPYDTHAHIEPVYTTFPGWKTDLTGPTAIIIGSEGNGPCDRALALSDGRILIPMPGAVESLNAGIAAGILIFEAVRQRSFKDEKVKL